MPTYMNETKRELRKQTWASPELRIVDIANARGASTGPLCDKHGSLSHGSC